MFFKETELINKIYSKRNHAILHIWLTGFNYLNLPTSTNPGHVSEHRIAAEIARLTLRVICYSDELGALTVAEFLTATRTLLQLELSVR